MFFDVGGEVVEGFVNVDVVFGGDFEEGDVEFIGKSLVLFGVDDVFFFLIIFVVD